MDDFISILALVFASSGFWTFVQFLMSKKHFKGEDFAQVKQDVADIRETVKGISKHRIIDTCNFYSDRGYISDEEYSDLYNELWLPYHDGLHGNGAAQRAMERVRRLPRREDREDDESERHALFTT